MDRGFYTSVSGMMCNTKQLADIANNVANVNTVGYKKDLSVIDEFSNHVINKLNDKVNVGNMTNQIYINDTHTIFSKGSLVQSGVPTDYAITEDGFFKVEKDGKYLYTKDGTFKKDVDGFMVTHDGAFVMNKNNQRIKMEDGVNYSNDILVVDFENKATLAKTDKGYYENRFGLSQEAAIDSTVMQGYLEMSNVDVGEELTDMIKCQRHYQFNQRSLQVYDDLLEKISQF